MRGRKITAVLDPSTAFLAPVDSGTPEGAGPGVPTGLLTLPARSLPTPADQVTTSVDGDVPDGSTATVVPESSIADVAGIDECEPAPAG